LKKLDDRSTPVIFVGYESGSKAYRFYDPNSRRVVVSRDAVFSEEGEWKWSLADINNSGHQEPFVIDYTEEVVRTTPLKENGGSASSDAPSPVAATPTPSGELHTPSSALAGLTSSTLTPQFDELDLDADHDETRRSDSVLSTPSSVHQQYLGSLSGSSMVDSTSRL
jgi:hypothetical protein